MEYNRSTWVLLILFFCFLNFRLRRKFTFKSEKPIGLLIWYLKMEENYIYVEIVRNLPYKEITAIATSIFSKGNIGNAKRVLCTTTHSEKISCNTIKCDDETSLLMEWRTIVLQNGPMVVLQRETDADKICQRIKELELGSADFNIKECSNLIRIEALGSDLLNYFTPSITTDPRMGTEFIMFVKSNSIEIYDALSKQKKVLFKFGYLSGEDVTIEISPYSESFMIRSFVEGDSVSDRNKFINGLVCEVFGDLLCELDNFYKETTPTECTIQGTRRTESLYYKSSSVAY